MTIVSEKDIERLVTTANELRDNMVYGIYFKKALRLLEYCNTYKKPVPKPNIEEIVEFDIEE